MPPTRPIIAYQPKRRSQAMIESAELPALLMFTIPIACVILIAALALTLRWLGW